MKKRTFWILAAGLFAVAVGAAAVGVVALVVGSGGGGWGGSRVLSLDVGGTLPDEPPPDFDPFFERDRTSLQSLVAAIDRAAADSDVSGGFVHITSLGGSGWGEVQELRGALMRFRATGKPLHAHLSWAGNREYYLATACSRIFALPTAIFDVSGLAAEVTFLEGALGKLGVEAQFEGEGRYKNAPNQYTESGFTPPHREQMNALLDSMIAQYLEGVAAGRGRSVEEARELVYGGPYDAQGALDAGLVDELLYRDEAEDRLSGAHWSVVRYGRSQGGFGFDGRSRIALIYAVGEIVPGTSESGLFGSVAGSDTISRALETAAEDSSYRGILLRVDSPGGFGPAADIIWRAVTRARERKPVVVSMGDAAASGGYYVAMGSDAIVAQPATITGSIGVFSGKFSLRGLYDKIGLTKEILTRGDRAAIYSDYRPWSAEERRRIRELNAAFYREFVSKAAEGRGMSYEELDAIAQGRVWTGAEALERGLVDRLGGFEEALTLLREKAGLDADAELRLEVLPRPRGMLETLFESDRQDVALKSLLGSELGVALRWARLLSPGGPTARLPFDLAIR